MHDIYMRDPNLLAVALLALACCCAPAHAAAPAANADRVSIPIDAATLAALPRDTVDADSHGHALTCEGVPLYRLLRHAGQLPAGELQGAQLARVVVARARDGDRVAFSLGEIDPGIGAGRVFVVDRCNGKPLDEGVGPVRLLVPDDLRAARWLRQLRSVVVEPAR